MAFLLDASPIALAVELGDTIVGFCLVMPSDAPYDSVNFRWFTERYDDFMYLDRVAFDAEAQGRGFGTLLYAEVARAMSRTRRDSPCTRGQRRSPERAVAGLPRPPRFRRSGPAGHAVRHPRVDADSSPRSLTFRYAWCLTPFVTDSATAVLEESEVVAGGCDVGGIEVGEQHRFDPGTRREDLTERVDDRAVTGVVEPAT